MVSSNNATVKIETTVENATIENQELIIKTEIINQAGEVVTMLEKPLQIIESQNNIITSELEFDNPKLWSPENPELYTAKIQLIKNGKILDETRKKFGIRSIEFSPEKGFLLNGKNILLKGGCLHHDNGILGLSHI